MDSFLFISSQSYITINIITYMYMSWIKQVKNQVENSEVSPPFLKNLQVSRFVSYGLHIMKDTLEDLDIFSFSDKCQCQYLKKNMAQSKRLELQTLGRPQNSWHKHVLWNFCNSLLAPSSLYYSSMLTLQGRLNSWPLSWIHLFDTHFWPTKTGHAACLVSNIPSPLRYKLYQNAAAPYKYISSIDFFIPSNSWQITM